MPESKPTIDTRFRRAFDTLTRLYSDERVEEYLAGEIEDRAIELAAAFGYTVDHVGQLVETPNCNAAIGGSATPGTTESASADDLVLPDGQPSNPDHDAADEFVTLIVQLRAERDRYSGALTDIAMSTSKWTDCAAIARAALTEEDRKE